MTKIDLKDAAHQGNKADDDGFTKATNTARAKLKTPGKSPHKPPGTATITPGPKPTKMEDYGFGSGGAYAVLADNDVMIEREYSARKAGEPAPLRGERRKLRRWIRSKHRFHQRIYEKVMQRTSEEVEQSKRQIPWRPHRDANLWRADRPTGRTQRLSDLREHEEEQREQISPPKRPSCPICGCREGDVHQASQATQCRDCGEVYTLPSSIPRENKTSRNNHRKRERRRQDQPETAATPTNPRRTKTTLRKGGSSRHRKKPGGKPKKEPTKGKRRRKVMVPQSNTLKNYFRI